jgi:hypothetical protein
MKKVLSALLGLLALSACSSTVIVKKDTCKDIYGGALMECQEVSK